MNVTDNIRSCQVQDLAVALHRTVIPWRTLLGMDGVIFLLKSESLDHGAHRPVQYHYIFPVKYSHFYIPKRPRIYKKMPILHHRLLTKNNPTQVSQVYEPVLTPRVVILSLGISRANIEQAFRPHSGVEWHFSCSMRSKWRHRAGISASQRPGTPLALLDELHECYSINLP